jgi:hypothetical protein
MTKTHGSESTGKLRGENAIVMGLLTLASSIRAKFYYEDFVT